jgi:ABC-type oligopeptide transport system substrate-binding subunit
MRHKLAAAVCTLLFAGLSASAALAGEVKGPPTGGQPATNFNTAATSHANSACVFSGLNDYINGQTDKQTQTPADGPPGAAGHGAGDAFPIGCRGGSNPDNPPAP